MVMTQEEQYYDGGYFATVLPKHIQTMLWNEIYSTDWVSDSSENIYKQIPSWYQTKNKYQLDPSGTNRAQFERQIGADVFASTPESLKTIGLELAQTHELDFFRRYYQEVELRYIDLWNGSEEIPYHFDTINGADTLVLIYLTEQDAWQQDWGGQISLRKKVNDVIIVEEEIAPNNGTMLVINNANPLVNHKVTALKNNKVNRYTFSFIYKWK
jgi:hypothetical protein